MSVSHLAVTLLLQGSYVSFKDFLAVRKIPIQKGPVFKEDGSPLADGDIEQDEEDPAVSKVVDGVRKVLVKDRALHDKVRISFRSPTLSCSLAVIR